MGLYFMEFIILLDLPGFTHPEGARVELAPQGLQVYNDRVFGPCLLAQLGNGVVAHNHLLCGQPKRELHVMTAHQWCVK